MARRVVAGALVVSACFLSSPASAVTLPPNFVLENATPGAAWNLPVALAFLPDGRMLVAEKAGLVWVVRGGVRHSMPLWDGSLEVLSHYDRGLIGIAVDPDFAANRRVYFLFTVDPDLDGDDNDTDESFGRLVRYELSAADSNAVDPASRTVLMGATWATGPVVCTTSHTIGTLRFANDGTLLVGAGDGANYWGVDAGGFDPNAFAPGRTDPIENIGAFRAQFIGSLAGKVLRIDPETGRGLPSNPYWNGNPDAPESKVWAYGLRNPFRFCVQPGTGSGDPADGDPGVIFIGDVGWNFWEDLNVATGPGMNFGWPCYEGIGPHADYQAATPAHHGCGTIGTPGNPAPHTQPVASWHHTNASLSLPPGSGGSTIVGGVYYDRAAFPAEYRERLFIADYAWDWIKVVTVDSSHAVVSVQNFAGATDRPVDLAIEPSTGALLYVSITTGQVRRIRYTGTLPNLAPVAVTAAAPDAGPAPLAVSFSSAGTQDPDHDSLLFHWQYGDGEFSTDANPTHVYAQRGVYLAVLTVNDGRGGIATDSVTVLASDAAFPLTAVLDDFDRADGPLGPLWIGAATTLAIEAGRLAWVGPGYASAVFDSEFGPDQEVFVTLVAVDGQAPEHGLMLKLQGPSPEDGHIEVRYSAPAGEVRVSTFSQATQRVDRGEPIDVTFVPEDLFGARAFRNGTIVVYRNNVPIGTRAAGDWPFAALGGRLGLTLDIAGSARLDDFGGGDVPLEPNTPPFATLLAPADSSFFVDGVYLPLVAAGGDAETPPGGLAYRWEVDLHHNVHVHPQSFVSDSQNTGFLGENHEDGTGTWLHLRLIVTDAGGLRDTAHADLFPETDLEPSDVEIFPASPAVHPPASYSFRIHNRGRMPARETRWRLVAGPWTLAQGDTVVAALDSVTVTVEDGPVPPPGTHDLRVMCDTLGVMVESEESNNARTRALAVSAPLGAVALALSSNLTRFGEATAATATVSSVAGVAPSGEVEFRRDGVTLAIGALAPDGPTSSRAEVTLGSPAVGPASITAHYLGDSDHAPGVSPPVVHQVLAAQTTTGVVVTPNPSRLGGAVAVAVTVGVTPPGAGTPDGGVTFLDGVTPLGPPVALVGGSAQLLLATPSPGSRSLSASYNGGAGNFSPSISPPVTLFVDASPPSVTLVKPTGGETFVEGAVVQIHITASDDFALGTMDLALSLDGGLTYPVAVATNVAYVDPFSWAVPALPCSTVRIRITVRDAAGNATVVSSASNLTIQAGSMVSTVGPPANCISSVSPSRVVTVRIDRTSTAPVLGYSVTVRLSPELVVSGGPAGFVEGDYLSSAGPAPTMMQVSDDGDGHYTVNGKILGAPCGATASTGTLFTVAVGGGSADGTGTVSITAVEFRDCDNNVLTAGTGGAAALQVDRQAPAAVTGLSAAQVRSGNETNGLTGVTVAFAGAEPDATFEVYRAPFGNYPGYDDGPTPGAEPAVPSYPPATPWVLTALTASGQTDHPSTRDFWYYVAFQVDACGNVSATSSRTAGTLDYHLGDTSDGVTACAGDAFVNTRDVSHLGVHYGAEFAAGDPRACLDVGPTSNTSLHGRPTTDRRLDFEDLAIVALNFQAVSALALAGGPVPPAEPRNALALRIPQVPRSGEYFALALEARGTGAVRAMSVLLDYDRHVVEPIDVQGGELLARQRSASIVLSSRPGNVDVALYGTNVGLAGSGELARVRFRVKASGDPGILLRSVEARDGSNGTVPVELSRDPPPAVLPAQTTLAPASPSPFSGTTTLRYSLRTTGHVDLTIFDVQGRVVRTVADGVQAAGDHALTWDGRDDAGRTTSPGLYLVRLRAEGQPFLREVWRTR